MPEMLLPFPECVFQDVCGLPKFPPAIGYPIPSMPVPDSTSTSQERPSMSEPSHERAAAMNEQQRDAATELLRKAAAPAQELGRIFTRHGHELVLVGGSVRDVFLGRASGRE